MKSMWIWRIDNNLRLEEVKIVVFEEVSIQESIPQSSSS